MPQGVAPPAQLRLVRSRMRYAETTAPLAPKRTADAPPVAVISEFDAYTQPPPATAKQAPPSGASCQRYDVFATLAPERATTRLVNPGGSATPLTSGTPGCP